jgi:hypothetical protein
MVEKVLYCKKIRKNAENIAPKEAQVRDSTQQDTLSD